MTDTESHNPNGIQAFRKKELTNCNVIALQSIQFCSVRLRGKKHPFFKKFFLPRFQLALILKNPRLKITAEKRLSLKRPCEDSCDTYTSGTIKLGFSLA